MILAANITTALYAGSSVLNDLLGWQGNQALFAGIVIMAISAGTYTIIGGLRSVLWVDLLQATILVGGGAIVFFVCVARSGGFGAALGTYDADGVSRWTLFKPWDDAFGWLPMATGAFVLGIHSHCTDQDYVQRALAARSAYHAKMGALLAGVLKIVALIIIAAPGVLAARLLPGMSHPDRVYARLISDFLPPGLSGIVLAGLLAAILGTVAAGLSASSSMISFDFLQRLRPGLSEHERVRAGRVIMVAVLVLCVFAAPAIAGFDGLFAYLVRIWSLLAPPVFVCVLFGTFTRRANGRGAGATLIVGVVLGALAFWALGEPAVLAHFPPYFRSSLNVGFLITLVCAGTMLVFSNGRSGHVRGNEIALVRAAFSGTGMSGRERAIYRSCAGSLLVVWLAVLLLFSPWGLARNRAELPASRSTS
jgi:SSS family solute:Na+ symporter